MKTFLDLVKEVQDQGLCHRCGGCVTFCTAINYSALALDENGMPGFSNQEKCIECGLCYTICPETDELEEETRKISSWEPPMGSILETGIGRALDPEIRSKATDGGVVTALLVHLFDRGHIDGAIVTRHIDLFNREPFLATTREEIIEAAGFYFDSSHGINHLSDKYSTYAPSVEEFRPMMQKHLQRVALVGTPCQIKAVRRIEALGIVPSDVIKYCFGLFCSGNFIFGEEERKKMEKLGGFSWKDLKKVNVKEKLMLHLKNGEVKALPLDNIDFMKRQACMYCDDYSAEYADISFGGIGAEEGWTSVICRTALGRAVYVDACENTVEQFKGDPGLLTRAMKTIQTASNLKKKKSKDNKKNIIKQ